MRKKKSNFIRRALVFASVFIILLMSCSTVIFAQAPNFEFNVPSSTPRAFREIYISDSVDILCIIYAQYNDVSLTSLKNVTVVASDYYYEQYYTGNDNTDATNMYYLYELNIFAFEFKSATFTTKNVSSVYLENIFPSFRITEIDFNDAFLTGLHNQFSYWESEIDYLENQITDLENNNLQFQRGYTQAVQDFDMFESGLFSIFQAPFVFAQNIIGFEIFGISIIDVLVFVLIVGLCFVIIKHLGGLFL